MARSVELLIGEIDAVASRGLPRKEFFAELAPRMRTVIDNDASCWHTLDPHTRLLTSDDPADVHQQLAATLDGALSDIAAIQSGGPPGCT